MVLGPQRIGMIIAILVGIAMYTYFTGSGDSMDSPPAPAPSSIDSVGTDPDSMDSPPAPAPSSIDSVGTDPTPTYPYIFDARGNPFIKKDQCDKQDGYSFFPTPSGITDVLGFDDFGRCTNRKNFYGPSTRNRDSMWDGVTKATVHYA